MNTATPDQDPAGQPPQPAELADPELSRIAVAALRLMADAVPKGTLAQLKKQHLDGQGGAYDWSAVTAQINSQTVDPQQLAQNGVRAQRDWIHRGGRRDPGPKVTRQAKGLVAAILARLIFFTLYTVAAVALLVLLKHRWEGLDIYRILDWVGPWLPDAGG